MNTSQVREFLCQKCYSNQVSFWKEEGYLGCGHQMYILCNSCQEKLKQKHGYYNRWRRINSYDKFLEASEKSREYNGYDTNTTDTSQSQEFICQKCCSSETLFWKKKGYLGCGDQMYILCNLCQIKLKDQHGRYDSWCRINSYENFMKEAKFINYANLLFSD